MQDLPIRRSYVIQLDRGLMTAECHESRPVSASKVVMNSQYRIQSNAQDGRLITSCGFLPLESTVNECVVSV
eukprot:COSAG02_NODE_81_length_39811_cov_51.728898_16_plen_72_part_00